MEELNNNKSNNVENNYSKMYKEWNYEEHGVKVNIDIMNNNEERLRFIDFENNSSYIKTISKDNAYWQKSHYHKQTKEVYIVIEGNITIAEKMGSKVQMIKVEKGNGHLVNKGVVHNVYMDKGTVVHTLKLSDNIVDKDWYSDIELDTLLKNIDLT